METLRIPRPGINWGPSIAIFLAVVAIAAIGGVATDTGSVWYQNLVQPSWQPPDWLFGPVWGTIYLLLALSAIYVWHGSSGAARGNLMALYGINGALNLAWSFIFFRGHAPLLAGVEIIILWCSILFIMVRVRSVSRGASLMLLPYLLWVGFASVLNWAIVRLN